MFTTRVAPLAGFGNCLWLDNGVVELAVTLDMGPRILYYGLREGENMLKIYDEQENAAFAGEAFQPLGGHRMGYYLGADDRYCLPDDGPVEYEQIEGGARFTQKPDEGTGMRKILEITLRPGSSEAVIRHILRNESGKECLCAPCSVTIMEEGGLEVIPQPCSDTRPRPNRMIAVWPYANMADPRVLWGHQYILLQQASMKRFKLGLSAEQGWVSYFNMGNLFVLRFAPEKGALYPDRGCSFETYTCEDMTDLEVLAPLRPLAPGETAQCEMSFTIFADVACPPVDEFAVWQELNTIL